MGLTKKKFSKQETKRIRAKALLDAGTPTKKITKVAKVSEKTLQRLQSKGTQRQKGSGRRKILDRSLKLSIRNTVKHNPFLTPQDIVERLQLPCSGETVRRYLVECGMSFRNLFSKEPLTEEEKLDRLEWCTEWATFEHFDEVVFTDETGYWLNDNRGKGWFPKGRRFDPIEVESTEKLNIWAGISMAGKVGIHVFDENFRGPIYEDILRDVLVPSARELYPDGCYLQRDNLSVHRSARATTYLGSREANVIRETIPWPSYSPDLNPVENLWAVLKNNIRKRQPRTLEELRNMIYEEWDDLSEDYVQSLCSSIYDRIDMCIENEGNRINY
jgi:transposase